MVGARAAVTHDRYLHDIEEIANASTYEEDK